MLRGFTPASQVTVIDEKRLQMIEVEKAKGDLAQAKGFFEKFQKNLLGGVEICEKRLAEEIAKLSKLSK